MNKVLGASPGAARFPQHKVHVRTSNNAWRVMLAGRTLAASDKTLVLKESGYEPVTYFPPQDVSSDLMLQSDSQTTCPFKGQANYFAASIDGKKTDIAWVYPAVYDEVDLIAGYIAFYADRVQIESVESNDN